MDRSMSSGGAEPLTARDLLQLYRDLCRVVPDLLAWSENALGASPYLLVRLKQLQALFRAFKIPWDPIGFREGSFLEGEDPRHVLLLKRVAAEIAERRLDRGSIQNQLPGLFSILLAYRDVVEPALSFSSGVMEAGGLDYYAHAKVAQVNQVIREQVQVVDDILVELISPKRTTFTRRKLVRDYGYPEDDLDQVDEDPY